MESKAEQFYPTYKSSDRDILLIEFQEAQSIANGQTKLYGQVTNILLALITVLITIFFNNEDENSKNTFQFIKENAILFSIILFLFGCLLIRYFVELQKQIIINARKVATLRTLLGVDYGSIHLTLPNWRVEGAINPFALKFFNGWLRFESAPFWVLFIGINSIWWLTTNEREPINVNFYPGFNLKIYWIIGNVIISVVYIFLFRTNLNDRHETNYLNFIKFIAWLLRIKVSENFEYILYRAKLAFIELDRLKINYEALKIILVEIEDIDFYNNSGVSLKSLARAFLSRFHFFRKKYKYIPSGGSTLTMQLARTLFIPSKQNKIKRKILEILLSFWLTKQFTKEEIIKLYISSVRYEKGILGLSKALKYFFDIIKSKELSNEESFILVERLSNITSTFKIDRINFLLTRTKRDIDYQKLINLYKTLIVKGKITDNNA